MQRRFLQPLIWIILFLALIGFLYQMINSPRTLITQLLIGAGIIGVMFFLFRRLTPGENGKYKKAVRQSKKRYGTVGQPSKKTTSLAAKSRSSLGLAKKKKRDHNFTVIEGKKNKKKNRASF